MRTRYFPWQLAPGEWGIIDWSVMEFCRLPVKDNRRRSGFRMQLLTWPNRRAADAFLQHCYLTWAAWEKNGTEKPDQVVPRDWRPRPDRPGPYASGRPFPAVPTDHG